MPDPAQPHDAAPSICDLQFAVCNLQPPEQGEAPLPRPEVQAVDLLSPPEVRPDPRFERPPQVEVREARLVSGVPWVRSLGKLPLAVSTEGWRFPTPPGEFPAPPKPCLFQPPPQPQAPADPQTGHRKPKPQKRLTR